MDPEELDERIKELAMEDPTVNVAIHTALNSNTSEKEFMILLILALSKIKENAMNKMVEMHQATVMKTIQIEGPDELINPEESIHHEELKGYDNLTKEQQKEFKAIFKKYMLSKGIDAREDIDIKSVEMYGRKFKISTIQWGLNGYAILDPVNQTWY